MKHFGGGLRSEALKKAYKQGHRVKGHCSICNQDIYNRMVYRVEQDEPAKGIYAHSHCAKTQPQFEWDRCW